MKKSTASQTAIFAAYMRATHQVLDPPPKILDDPVAVGLVPGSDEAIIRASEADLQTPLMRLGRSVAAFRTRFAEDELRKRVDSGVRQYVLLGAGMDTFAYRQPAWAHDIRIIEVDSPASQEYKRERLSAIGLQIPENVVFCPIDFEKSTVSEVLGEFAYKGNTGTFFTMLGVTQYLSKSALESTLSFIASRDTGSGVVASFILPDEMLTDEDLEGAQILSEVAADQNEPWLTRLTSQNCSNLFSAAGFSDVFHLTPEEAFRRYFTDREDELRVPIIEQMVRALV